jgi:hypothetical protein
MDPPAAARSAIIAISFNATGRSKHDYVFSIGICCMDHMGGVLFESEIIERLLTDAEEATLRAAIAHCLAFDGVGEGVVIREIWRRVWKSRGYGMRYYQDIWSTPAGLEALQELNSRATVSHHRALVAAFKTELSRIQKLGYKLLRVHCASCDAGGMGELLEYEAAFPLVEQDGDCLCEIESVDLDSHVRGLTQGVFSAHQLPLDWRRDRLPIYEHMHAYCNEWDVHGRDLIMTATHVLNMFNAAIPCVQAAAAVRLTDRQIGAQ